MNNRTYSTPKGQTVKNDSAVTQAAKTETNVKYVGLQKPNDVNLELENRLQEIEMKTEELINLYNGGINVSTAGQTSVVNEYGADRETDTDENEAVSNVKVYNRKLYRGSKLESAKESAPIVSRDMIKMRPTLPYYYRYSTSCQEQESGQPTGGTATMYLDFNTYKYPVKLTTSKAKYCQAMIVGCGGIKISQVKSIDRLEFSFPNVFATARIDPDSGEIDPVSAWNTATLSITQRIMEHSGYHPDHVILYNEVGYAVDVDLGPHIDQIAYYPGGSFSFPPATHLKYATISGEVEFSFIIQGHIPETLFDSYEWSNCAVKDDRVDPMGWWFVE